MSILMIWALTVSAAAVLGGLAGMAIERVRIKRDHWYRETLDMLEEDTLQWFNGK